MGGAKTWMMEQEARGYDGVEGYICADCLGDPALKQYVAENACATECSFCDESSEEHIAADFDDVLGQVVRGIAFDWNDPNNEGISYNTQEGGYLAPLTETWELLSDYNVSENDKVLDAMVSSIQTENWVEREFYWGTEDQILMYGWSDFCRTIMHKTRYLFSRVQADGYAAPEIPPAEFLPALASFINNFNNQIPLIRTLTVDEKIIRVRICKKYYGSAKELAAPPVNNAIQSNRMSPAGIPMFYGAFDEDTAIQETYDESKEQKNISIGTFVPLRPLKLLDLCSLPEIPSVFDLENQNLIAPLRFLHDFSTDIAKSIERDGREHIDYVPTQVVTEFFRHIYKTKDGQKLDGIIYRSSKNSGKPTCVIFCENEQACDLNQTPTQNQILRLVTTAHRKLI